MENKKFLQIGLSGSIITIFCLIISLMVSLATNYWIWELGNLPLPTAEIFIIIFGIIIGISGIFSGVFIAMWIIKSKT